MIIVAVFYVFYVNSAYIQHVYLTTAAIKLAFDERQMRRQQRSTHKKQCDQGVFNVALPTAIIVDSVEIRVNLLSLSHYVKVSHQ